MSQAETIPIADTTTRHSTKSQRRESDCGINAKRKLRNIKNGRKRAKSFSAGGLCKINYMRPILPTRFLLGGNIRDPLNLNSLQNEEINRAVNAVTPKSSPIPTPPRKRHKLKIRAAALFSIKKCRKKRVRKKRTSSGTSEVADADQSGCIEAKTPENNTDSAKIPEVSTVTDGHHKDVFKKFKYSGMDKIVSPVVPQPGGWLKRSNSRRDLHHHREIKRNTNKNEKMPEFKEKNKQFQYGNYNRYYGYRNQHSEVDLRLLCFSNHREMFVNKDILDIGCNIGHITLSVARDFGAKSIVGVDIDKKLIEIAHKNIKHYVKRCDTPPHSNDDDNNRSNNSEFFPISMPILYGPLEIPGFTEESDSRRFPKNVIFKHGNYVLDDDSLLSVEQPQFDIILCLSITKWIHLNWGDAGIKQAFRRMYAQLRPGGKLILEPQNWASYKGKKKLTEKIYKNYNSIQLFPETFTQYLLSNEVGFAKSEILGFPQHQARGFQRPIQVYSKSQVFSSERSENSNYSVNRDTPVYIRPYTEPFVMLNNSNDKKESVIISDEISETTSN
ncbi:hypothetical protein RI129_006795 [Pyrocoelia pectoralis]|uniref:RNA methyltransferase n=1 Tax=Pyrocoelia pectoralis TaxID=417401 RepID=A0AAN7VBY0_9COLE